MSSVRGEAGGERSGTHQAVRKQVGEKPVQNHGVCHIGHLGEGGKAMEQRLSVPLLGEDRDGYHELVQAEDSGF